MAVSARSTGDDIASDLRMRVSRLEGGLMESARAAAALVKRATEGTLTADTGGDRRLSGASVFPPMTVDVSEHDNGASGAAINIMAGPRLGRAPWFWLDEGTKPGPRPRRPNKRGPNWKLRAVGHAGTKGKRTWQRAVLSVDPAADATLKRKIDRLVTD